MQVALEAFIQRFSRNEAASDFILEDNLTASGTDQSIRLTKKPRSHRSAASLIF